MAVSAQAPTANLDAQAQSLARRRALAMQLIQMSQQPLQQPNVRGAQISPWEGVSKLAQAVVGGYQNNRLDTEQAQLTNRQDADRFSTAQALVNSETPQAPPEMLDSPVAVRGIPGPTAQIPPSPDAVAKRQADVSAMARALSSRDPSLQKVAAQGFDQMITDRANAPLRTAQLETIRRDDIRQESAAKETARHNAAVEKQAVDTALEQKKRDEFTQNKWVSVGKSDTADGPVELFAPPNWDGDVTKLKKFSYGAPKTTATKSLQSKDMVMKDGTRAVLNFDPGAGKYFIPSTGVDVSDKVAGDYHPPTAAATEASKPVDPEIVKGWVAKVQQDSKNWGLIPDKATKTAVSNALALSDKQINTLDSQTRDASKFATAALEHIQKISSMIDSLDKRHALGVVESRWNDMMTGKIGSDRTISKDNQVAFSELRNNILLLDTAMGRVHGGARGGSSPYMIEHMKSMLNAGKMDAATLRSSMSVFKDWLTTYSEMGGGAPASTEAIHLERGPDGKLRQVK